MQEKILAKLKEQRGQNSQVSDKTLEAMAKTWSNVIKDDETLNGIDFTDQISSFQGNIGHIAKQVKEDTEKAYKQVVKTPEQIPSEEAEKKRIEEDNKSKGISPELAALMEQNKQIMETLSRIQGEKITTTRSQKLESILKDAPKAYKDQVIGSFSKMNFDDDSDFEGFINTTKTNFEGFQQMAKEQGISFVTPTAVTKKQEGEQLNPVFKAALEAKAEADKANV